MYLGLILISLLFQHNPFAKDASPEFIVNHFTITDGLPLNAVLQIVQSENGFLYMATFDGLVRYDGYDFKTYNRINSEGLSNSRISNIGIDADGIIWLASPYGNLSSFDGLRFTNHDQTNLSDLPQFTGFDAIAAEVASLGSSQGGAIPFRDTFMLRESGRSIHIDSTTVTIDDLLVITGEELRGGFEDSEGTLWINTRNNGLFQIKFSQVRNFNQSREISFHNTYSVIENRPGEIWIKGFHGFTLRFTDEDARLQNFNRVDGEVRNLQYLFWDEVKDGIFGYSEAIGIRRFDGEGWPEEEWFSSIMTDERPGLYAAHRNRDGVLLVGTSQGLIIEDGEHTFWAAEKTGYPFRWVRTIRESADGTLWMGTNGFGLYRLNLTDWSWQQYTYEDGMFSNFIRDIHIASPDTLWLATQDRGLSRIILDDSFAIREQSGILPSDGLLNHGLHRIIPDQWGHLWVNSNGGIMRFTKDNLDAYASGLTSRLKIIRLTEEQGLANNEGNGGVDNAGIMLQNGLIVFPNQAGVVIINPEDFLQIRTSDLNKPIIDAISFANITKKAAATETFELPRGERDFRISFTLPNFRNPELVSFSYRLTGLQTRWRQPVSSRTAVFTNVPPGRYLFEVEALGPNGTYSTAALPVVIPHHFYETIWFFILCGILFMGFVFALHRNRTQKLRAQERKTRSMLDLQTCYVIRTDLSGNYTYANPKFLETFGFLYVNNQSRLIAYQGASILSAVHKSDKQKVRDTMTELLKNPESVIQVEMRKPLPYGKYAYTLWDFSVIFKPNGKPDEFQCVGIDFTERREQEKLLRESEHKLQRIIESIPHPMLIVDENLMVQSCNNEFMAVFEYEDSEITGKSAEMLLPDATDSARIHNLRALLEESDTPKRMAGFQKARTKSGRELFILLSSNHFNANNRKLIILILQDVTELKARQDVIIRQNKALRDIAWHQSHVVRRPVANILGIVDLLQHQPGDILQQQPELLEMLQKTTTELDDIVREIVRKSNETEFLED